MANETQKGPKQINAKTQKLQKLKIDPCSSPTKPQPKKAKKKVLKSLPWPAFEIFLVIRVTTIQNTNTNFIGSSCTFSSGGWLRPVVGH